MSDATELDLIGRARAGDEQAIRALYERHAPRVYALARRLAGDDALAEDWAQEAWVRALRSLHRFRGDARFSTWLHRIAINSALHGRRWSERRRGRETELNAQHRHSAPEETPLLRMHLQRALDELPAGMRRVLVLHDVEGYTHEDIGEMLDIATGTSKSQLFKARARMRELLAAPRRPVEVGHVASES